MAADESRDLVLGPFVIREVPAAHCWVIIDRQTDASLYLTHDLNDAYLWAREHQDVEGYAARDRGAPDADER